MERTAQCLCGSLRAMVSGEPLLSYLCHCHACQRRSGAAVHSGAYFHKAHARYEGTFKVYRRKADSGFGVQHYFCPECGTTVYWETDKYPDRFGIAVGCFADSAFPPPTLSMYEESKHPWLGLSDAIEHLDLGFAADGQPMTRG